MDTLVTADWLAAHLAEEDLVVLDCTVEFVTDADGMRPVSGRDGFDAAHVPGARFADLVVDLSDTGQPIGFAVPTPENFCSAMSRLGVGDDSRVVLYDATISAWAARVWWMLRWVGFDRAAVLDGGLGAWRSAGHGCASGEPDVPPRPATLTPRVRPELIADRHEVLAAIGDDAITIVDTLGPENYSGERPMYARPGHIPGAINVFCMDLQDESGRLEPGPATVARHGGDTSRRMITYCGGGIAASLNAFAMHRAGFGDVAVYTASLQEWAADPSLPLVSD